MAWNLTVCTSPNLMKMSNKNRGEQVLGIASPQVSPSFRDGESPVNGGGSPKRPFYSAFDQQDEVMDEDPVEDSLQQTEKKRRLTSDQVKFLEMSFEVENKLEPERKSLIAKQLGLQPRQVAVWFQNRRARWKTKQLEKDYDVLKTEYNNVLTENEKLKAEVARLKAQLLSPTGNNGGDVDTGLEDPEVEREASQLGELQTETQPALDKTEDVSSVCGKSDLGSPTKSDLSEVLDSGSCSLAMDRGCELKVESSPLPPALKVEDSTVIAASEEQQAFVNICNPLVIQQVAVKLETGIFPDDSYSFIFSWDDHSMFPWYD